MIIDVRTLAALARKWSDNSPVISLKKRGTTSKGEGRMLLFKIRASSCQKRVINKRPQKIS